MRKIRILSLLVSVLFFYGCENFVTNEKIDSIISRNDLNILLKIDDNNDYQIKEVSDNDNYLKIDVIDEFTIRGKTKIEIGKKYKLSITLKNLSASPVILYSFWKDPVTSRRNYTLAGENGNPPISKTQELHTDWTTFYDYFEAKEGEDSFMLTIFCKPGTFHIKDIKIEEVRNRL
jgi:hypothetical protein